MKCPCCTRAATVRSGSSCDTLGLAINDGHVVEVAPAGLERPLADPVLASKLVVIDPDTARRNPGEDHRVLGQRVADGAAVPRGPGPHRGPRPAGFHPD